MRPPVISSLKGKLLSAEAFLTVLLVCSVALNVFFTLRVKRLEEAILDLKGENKLELGETVPPIEGKDLEGRPVMITYDGVDRPTMLYVFSPQCGWCERNSQNINSLAKQLGDRYRLIGLSLSPKDLKEYAGAHGMEFPVYTDLPFSVTSAYKLSGTPETIIISPEGRVVQAWPGAYTGQFQHEVESFFNVSLPGLSEPQKQ
jgi:peroxiredoxin